MPKLPEVSRHPLPRAPESKRIRVIFCGGHHAGWAALSAFVEPSNWCAANCEVVAVVPDQKNIPSAKGSLWEKDDSRWRIRMVPNLSKKHGLPLRRLNLYPGKKFNEQLLALIKETDAQAILSCTFRGIFRKAVIDAVGGAAYNIHPTGIAIDRLGRPQLAWPQPLFEGKQAFDMMMDLSERFRKKKKINHSDLDCQAMEWVIHRILPPPDIDRGEFIGANRFPMPLPHEEQLGRDKRKQFNGLQSHCAAAIPELLHHWGPHLFMGKSVPWTDPRKQM